MSSGASPRFSLLRELDVRPVSDVFPSISCSSSSITPAVVVSFTSPAGAWGLVKCRRLGVLWCLGEVSSGSLPKQWCSLTRRTQRGNTILSVLTKCSSVRSPLQSHTAGFHSSTSCGGDFPIPVPPQEDEPARTGQTSTLFPGADHK